MTDNQETLKELFVWIENADTVLENHRLTAHEMRIQMQNCVDAIEIAALKLSKSKPYIIPDNTIWIQCCQCICGCNNAARVEGLCWICSQADAKFHLAREGVLIG